MSKTIERGRKLGTVSNMNAAAFVVHCPYWWIKHLRTRAHPCFKTNGKINCTELNEAWRAARSADDKLQLWWALERYKAFKKGAKLWKD